MSIREKMFSVMANQGFSGVTYINDDKVFEIPKSALTKKGLISKKAFAAIKDMNTKILSKFGIGVRA
jgi:uncharacterized membrane protein (Fun14 family)